MMMMMMMMIVGTIFSSVIIVVRSTEVGRGVGRGGIIIITIGWERFGFTEFAGGV